MLSKIVLRLNTGKWSLPKIWLIFFSVTFCIILLVQLLILPYIFPSWHAGNGLLVGGDWLAFHDEALSMVERIKLNGWSEWELWPKGWFPSGIAGALYALIWPKPWVLAPLNAAVHAFSALMVIAILNLFTGKQTVSFVASLPFVFFPTTMLWYTQIHRDGYNILGMLLFIYGMMIIAGLPDNLNKYRYQEGIGFITAISGTVLLWLSRPHTVIIFLYAGFLIFLIVAVYLTGRSINKTINWKNALFKLCLFAIVLSSLFFFTRFERAGGYLREPDSLSGGQIIENNDSKGIRENYLLASNDGLTSSIYLAQSENDSDIIREEDFEWSRTPYLPLRIDNQFYSIAIMRTVWYPISYGRAASNIDRDVSFHSAIDFISYLPRALQIAFLAPFPRDWFGEGSYETTTFFRRIAALEMIFVYLMLIPMGYGLWIWRKKIEVYMLFIFCTLMMLPIIYTIPNLGTIYRYRYGYLMLLVSFGVAALCHFWESRKTGCTDSDQSTISNN